MHVQQASLNMEIVLTVFIMIYVAFISQGVPQGSLHGPIGILRKRECNCDINTVLLLSSPIIDATVLHNRCGCFFFYRFKNGFHCGKI